jgi:hypothetical protein
VGRYYTAGLNGMDRAVLEQRLTQAERHVAEGEDIVARQREIVAELAKDHHDVRFAQELLTLFETTQALHIADRDRIQAELAAMR